MLYCVIPWDVILYLSHYFEVSFIFCPVSSVRNLRHPIIVELSEEAHPCTRELVSGNEWRHPLM